MNSEELELSLRTEFEHYLKDVYAGMRQDVAELQKNFEAEFEKHKAQMDEAFRNLSARFESEVKFDQAFTESVVEHLRLARDDGAQLTAEAFAEAQKLEAAPESARYDQLRDAINDVSSQLTQSAILKSLVDHAASFTSRGAFFIVKHDSFVCWRRFDSGDFAEDESVRDIHFPLTDDTLLADAVGSMSTRDSDSSPHGGDSAYLDALGFGRPERMFAVPLVARGRGVAVLYVDGDNVNVEAVETLVRVAGLTVELRAAAAAATQTAVAEAPAHVPEHVEEEEPQAEATSPEPSWAQVPVEESFQAEESSEEPEYRYEAPVEDSYTAEVSPEFQEYSGEVSVEEHEVHEAEVSAVEVTPEPTNHGYFDSSAVPEIVSESNEYSEAPVEEPVYEERVNDFAFASSDSYDASAEAEPEPEPVEEYSYTSEVTNGTNGHSYEPAPEPVVEAATVQPVKSRLSDRNVDLPIEVADGDERRLHNDARRFARLLVSEIKLYNEQRVNEGRDMGDLYDRLREAIDRSREMYDKRVKPEVAAKFDYFHYELVSNLAEGNDAKLGASYPGASV